jgi:prepilin signal peptidase PulO-like enzyme (type II secretory pathway)
MKRNSITIQLIFAILSIALLAIINKTYPLEDNLTIGLVSLCGLVAFSLLTLAIGFRNVAYGIVYGLIVSVGLLIYYIFQLLIERL